MFTNRVRRCLFVASVLALFTTAFFVLKSPFNNTRVFVSAIPVFHKWVDAIFSTHKTQHYLSLFKKPWM